MIARIGLLYEGFCLIFDTETETDPETGMRLRFGAYQIRGCAPDEKKAEAKRLLRLEKLGMLAEHDFTEARKRFKTLQEEGFFFREETMTAEEIALLYEVAAERPGMRVMRWEDWLEQVFVGAGEYWQRHWKHTEFHSLTIGHNLPFDISTVATRECFARGQSYGGFSYRVCGCGYAREHDISCPDHPSVTIRQIAQGKNFIRWKPCKAASRKNRGKGTRRDFNIPRRHFIARALLGPGQLSLEALTETLGCKTRKVRTSEHGGILTREYIEYAANDVQATWEVYVALSELYRLHGVRRYIWRIYSEASLGAAYLSSMKVTGFLTRHDVPKDVLAKFMETFYGGRSEVMIRLQPCDIIYCDVTSQYPTVNRLMDLQSLLLAERIEVRRDDPDTIKWLHTVTREAFREKVVIEGRERWPAWERLHGIALVEPAGDILPVRAPYVKDFCNIALPVINASPAGPAWWTFADVLASRFLTGKMPSVLATIELVPNGRIRTEPFKLFGKEEYTIDLSRDDLFQHLIDLRQTIKKEMDTATDERYQYLNKLQLALKLLANATSYGKLVEFIVNEMEGERICHAYIRDDMQELHEQRTEHPGSHFAPFGTLIPAAGRFMLAIAETSEQGVSHVLCDTDGMTFARPDGCTWEEFEARGYQVVDWFTAVNPYEDRSKSRGSVFAIEHGAEERLRCLAISAKRYAFYRGGDAAKGEPRVVIEKISAHGLGAYWDPPGYVSRYPDAPLPGKRNSKAEPKRLGDIVAANAAPRLSYDIWREAIEAIEFEGRDPPEEREWLRHHLYIDQANVGTAHVAKLYDAMPGLRSYSFFSVVPHLVPKTGFAFFHDVKDAREQHLMDTGFYGPKADCVEDIIDKLRFRDTGELVNLTDVDFKNLQFQTLEHKLRGYLSHPEATAWKPNGIGQLQRRHVIITSRKYMGKESDIDDDDPDVMDDPRLHKDHLIVGEGDPEPGEEPSFNPLYNGISIKALERLTGIDAASLRKHRAGKAMLPQETVKKIRDAIEGMLWSGSQLPKPPMPVVKPPDLKNMWNLTAGGKRSAKGDTLRVHIDQLRPEPARSPLGRLAMALAGVVPRHTIYDWYRRGSRLSVENEALLKATIARLQEEDTERVKAEAAEQEERNRRLEERGRRRIEKRLGRNLPAVEELRAAFMELPDFLSGK